MAMVTCKFVKTVVVSLLLCPRAAATDPNNDYNWKCSKLMPGESTPNYLTYDVTTLTQTQKGKVAILCPGCVATQYACKQACVGGTCTKMTERGKTVLAEAATAACDMDYGKFHCYSEVLAVTAGTQGGGEMSVEFTEEWTDTSGWDVCVGTSLSATADIKSPIGGGSATAEVSSEVCKHSEKSVTTGKATTVTINKESNKKVVACQKGIMASISGKYEFLVKKAEYLECYNSCPFPRCVEPQNSGTSGGTQTQASKSIHISLAHMVAAIVGGTLLCQIVL